MGESETAVRLAGPEDAASVARLLHDFNTEFDAFTPGVEALTANARELLAAGEARILLGGDGPGGVCLLRFRTSIWTGGPEAYLQELYVVPALRGRGIGRALVETSLDLARAEGARWIELGTEETDTAARALYESCGFSNREGGPDGPLMFFYEREL